MIAQQQRRDLLSRYPLYRTPRYALWFLLLTYSTMTLAAVITLLRHVPVDVPTAVSNTVGAVGLLLTVLALVLGRVTTQPMPVPEERDGGVIVMYLDMIRELMGNERLPYLAMLTLFINLAFNFIWYSIVPMLGVIVNAFVR